MGRDARREQSANAGSLSPRRRDALRRRLLDWYRAERRDLPWRRSRDPYAIWISETMLQQTRVETVIPYWERFLERFPDVGSLATADTDDVLEQWTGLGYYTRARNLHRAARDVVDKHDGRLPDDVDALRALPGVGRYTAGALASIAFDRPEPIVDGNVARVLTRLFGIDEDVKSPPVVRRLWALAEQLAQGESPGDFNQALMELGALRCTPRAPQCGACPWTRSCVARRTGRSEEVPRSVRRTRAKRVEAVAGWFERRGRVLFVQRPKRGLLGGMWELPGADLADGESPEHALARGFRDGLGLELPASEALGAVEHLFTHRKLRLHLRRCAPSPGRLRRRGWDAHRWVSPEDFDALPLGGPARKAVARVRAGEPQA